MEINKELDSWFEHANKSFSESREKEYIISFKDFINTLKDYYSSFKEEYNNMEKMDIGPNNNIKSYYIDKHYRSLQIQINEQEDKTIVPSEYGYCDLIISEDEYGMSAYFKKNRQSISSIKGVDSSIIKGYLDIFSKYYPLFELYIKNLQNFGMVCNGKSQLHINFNTHNDSLINGLDALTIIIQEYYEMGDTYIMKVHLDMKDNIRIDCNKSSVIKNDEKIKGISKEFYQNALNNLCFESKLLSEFMNKANEKPKKTETMSNYQMKKEEYLKKISNNPTLINRIITDNNKTEKGRETLKLLLNPKSEKEVDAAEMLFTMIGDILHLMELSKNDELIEIPNEENEGLKEYIRIINLLKENKDINKEISPKESAKIFHEWFLALLNDYYGSIEYIAKKTGFDLNNEFEVIQFNDYMDYAKKTMDNSFKELDDYTEKEIEKVKEIAHEFHILCEKSKKENNNNESHSRKKELYKGE